MIDIRDTGQIQNLLDNYAQGDQDHWAFRGMSKREHAHAFVQYPAMMVPQMQSELISTVMQIEPSIKSIYDPFVGSGTVMTEAMVYGLDFTGNDINPLAILICKAKKGPFFVAAVEEKISRLIEVIEKDNKDDIDIKFINRDKWFKKDTAIALSKIRRAIQKESSLWCRRLLWLALAETVRLTSNSRTSTYKLHIRPVDEIENRDIDPVVLFKELLANIYNKLDATSQLLKEKDLIRHGHYIGKVAVNLQDSRVNKQTCNRDDMYDLIVTSPPYGDNNTTVPYGQYSYLPLQWINLNDIEDTCDTSWLISTHEIDRRSLGGTRAKAMNDIRQARATSQTLDEMLYALEDEPRDRSSRIAAFYRDVDLSLDCILDRLKPNGYMIWTLGNRRVSNKLVPMDDILSELLVHRGARIITKFQRDIPSKRTAIKNRVAETMTSETVLIMQKGDK